MHSMPMQILYDLSLQHRNSNVKRWVGMLSLCLWALLGISCSRSTFSLISVQQGVSNVTLLNEQGKVLESFESLSLYVETEDPKASDLQIEVISPDGASQWTFMAEKREVDTTTYYGSSNLVMGSSLPMMQGAWKVQVLNADGRTLSDTFTIETYPERRTPLDLTFDPLTKTIQMGKGIAEYKIQLLDEKRKVLYESLQSSSEIVIGNLFASMTKVKFIVLAYFDDHTNMTELISITL